jgi:hypothetical protein
MKESEIEISRLNMAGTKYLVFVILSGEWENFHRRRLIENVAYEIGEESLIVCVNRPFDLLTSLFRIKVTFKRLKSRKAKQIQKNLWVIRPIIILHDVVSERFNIKLIKKLNVIMLRRQINNFIRNLLHTDSPSKFKKIVWIYSPFHISYYSIFSDALKIYECYDEYQLNPDGSMNIDVVKKEKVILDNSDIVFVTSRRLFESRSKLHSYVFNIGNGVDTDFFINILKNSSEPTDLKGIPHPRILYVGNLGSWLDEKMIIHSVDKLPEMQFIFLGPVSNNELAKKLKMRKNVYFLGVREYKEVPLYIKWCDVCIAPFKLNKFTVNVNPLKVYEYLYIGKPVVATPLPELLYLNNVIFLAEDENEFIGKIRLALCYSEDPEQIRIRKETAEKFSLKSIAKNIINYIYSIINES